MSDGFGVFFRKRFRCYANPDKGFSESENVILILTCQSQSSEHCFRDSLLPLDAVLEQMRKDGIPNPEMVLGN